MSLILRKLNFAADWKAVGRRCVVNPECCRTYNVSVCTNECGWVFPDTLYVTIPAEWFIGWDLGGPPVPTQTFECRLLPFNELNVSDMAYGGAGTDSFNPVWGLKDVDLSSVVYDRITDTGIFDPAPGPRHAKKIFDVNPPSPSYLRSVLHATCFVRVLCVPETFLPPAPENIRLCVVITFWHQNLAYGLPPYWINTHPPQQPACALVDTAFKSGNIGRDDSGNCTQPQLPADIEGFSVFALGGLQIGTVS